MRHLQGAPVQGEEHRPQLSMEERHRLFINKELWAGIYMDMTFLGKYNLARSGGVGCCGAGTGNGQERSGVKLTSYRQGRAVTTGGK